MTDEMAAMAANIGENITNLFLDEDERDPIQKIECNNNNMTDFFTGHIIALHFVYKKITSEKCDLIEFIGVLNKLIFQFLQKKN